MVFGKQKFFKSFPPLYGAEVSICLVRSHFSHEYPQARIQVRAFSTPPLPLFAIFLNDSKAALYGNGYLSRLSDGRQYHFTMSNY